MKEYVCGVCGYVHKTDVDLPSDFVCPLCGAGRDAFRLKSDAPAEMLQTLEKPHVDRALSPMEMSIICSNLARGCEKQYMSDASEHFRKLAAFFASAAQPVQNADVETISELLDQDLTVGFPYGHAVATGDHDRGALRCQVWAEKVTRMLQSLLARYQSEGEAMLRNTGVYVCTICGFVYVGDEPPAMCPVCKVPSWKFEKAEGRA